VVEGTEIAGYSTIPIEVGLMASENYDNTIKL